MPQVFFRFYAELNDLLPAEKRQLTFAQSFKDRVTVKHLIESLGVPHAEVDLILIDGRPVGFDHIVAEGERISVYPVFESMDVGEVSRLRPRPLRESRFVLDTHLGQLASYLRLLGFDTLYRNDFEDPELARISQAEKRILLTKDRGVLKRKIVTHGYVVRETEPARQLVEVVDRFDLRGQFRPFTRCLRCNGLIESVDKAAVVDQLPADTRRYYDEFRRCASCGQVYWQGSHYQRMVAFLRQTLGLKVG
ncbi:MAG: Mut7-C RNAse domain-containing protein [Chloroflexota bacterium]|jgi:hypothetical protein